MVGAIGIPVALPVAPPLLEEGDMAGSTLKSEGRTLL
jgi:hypothetical protein